MTGGNMRVKVLGSVVVAVLLAGCGTAAGNVSTPGSESPSTAAATGAGAAQTATITVDQAEEALLGVTDLPEGAGWMLKPPSGGSGGAGQQGYDVVDPAECDPSDIAPELAHPTGTVEASAAFQDGGDNTFTMEVQSGLTVDPDELLDFIEKRLETCPTISTLSGTQSIRADYEPSEDFPALGDRTLAFGSMIESSTRSWPVWVYTTYVVIDGTLLTFTASGPSAAGDGNLRELVPEGVEQLLAATR